MERAVLRQAAQTFDPPPAFLLCLGTMAARAQRLQVGQVIRAALRLRNDMVHLRCGRDTSGSGTFATQIRVTFKHLPAQETPAPAIPARRTVALAGTEPSCRVLTVLLAIAGDIDQPVAAWVPAYHLRSGCHVYSDCWERTRTGDIRLMSPCQLHPVHNKKTRRCSDTSGHERLNLLSRPAIINSSA